MSKACLNYRHPRAVAWIASRSGEPFQGSGGKTSTLKNQLETSVVVFLECCSCRVTVVRCSQLPLVRWNSSKGSGLRTVPTSPCEKALCEWLHFLELMRLKCHYKVRTFDVSFFAYQVKQLLCRMVHHQIPISSVHLDSQGQNVPERVVRDTAVDDFL